MEFRKVRRLAGVLIASQMRSGSSSSDPRGFLGRPSTLAVIDGLVFVALFSFSLFASRAIESVRPGLLEGLLGSFLPFVPLLGVAAVLVGGLMFELATTSKFSGSDAVNWLPIRSADYVVASSLALTALYSLSIVVLAGIAIGVGVVAGMLPLALFAVALGVGGLMEGALLIEILRAVTQRAGALGRKRGSAALVLRAAVFLVVILGFQLFFNPVILYDSVQAFGSLGPLALAIPFLWGSDAVRAAIGGDWVGTVAGIAGEVGLLFATAVIASHARSRFWVPTGGEVEFDRHRYGDRHAVLRALGLGRAGSALVAKDLRGIVRRRELLPGLLLPFVIGILVVVQTRTGGGNHTAISGFFELGLLAWVSGLSALLLSSASYGQERKGVVHLYVLPIRAAEVYRAKIASTLLVSLPVGFLLTALGIVVYQPALPVDVAMVGIVVTLVVEATVIGLAFAARYSDFQDRPRPQFVRSIPMLAATAVYFLIGGATGALAFAVASGFLPGTLTGPVLFLGAAVILAIVVAVVWLGSSGVRRLLRELPS